jgi:hypothetical protein
MDGIFRNILRNYSVQSAYSPVLASAPIKAESSKFGFSEKCYVMRVKTYHSLKSGRVVVCFNQAASIIVNPNHGIMGPAVKLYCSASLGVLVLTSKFRISCATLNSRIRGNLRSEIPVETIREQQN